MLDQEHRERSTTTPANTTNGWLIGVIIVVALALIGATMWALGQSNEADTLAADLEAAEAQVTSLQADLADAEAELSDAASTMAALQAQLGATPEFIVVGGGQPTERQAAMVAMVTGSWAEAWTAADAAAVTAMFTPDAVMYDIEGGETLRIDDGTIERFAGNWAGLRHLDGVLVHGDKVVTVVELAGREVGVVLDFTAEGDLLIEWSAMYDSALGPTD